jgi:hypothetical protein
MKQRLLNIKFWNEESGHVWKEIVSRWGQADYDDETKRAEHKATLKLEWEAYQYGRDRQKSYPSIGDQLDDLFKKGIFSDEMATKLQTVKSDNPKG